MGKVIDDFKSRSGEWERDFTAVGVRFKTASYVVWMGIRQRCNGGDFISRERPTYIDCSMSEYFKVFQNFADWYTSQIGYGVKGYHIDKDLLIPGNKEYGENKCVLIPASLNTFLCANDAIRGILPQGMSFHKRSGKYLAQINKDGKGTHIGYYSTIEEACGAYKKAKEAEAKRWYNRLVSREFIVDPRVIECMRTWSFMEPA